MNSERVHFYSANDLSVYTNIETMEKVVKAYEDEIAAEKRKMAETKPKGLTPDVIREIEESVLGIHYEE